MAVTPKPVIFIGAADAICGKAIEFFAAASTAPIVLADADEHAIRQRTSSLAPGRATIRRVDIFSPSELRDLMRGAALVVLGAQPYYKTSGPVLAACCDARVPYLDFSDDVKSTQESLSLSKRAQQQGIPCYINCGASPGMTNLMALDAATELDADSVDTIDVCWYVTDRGNGENGKDVLEHLMHIAAGPCPTWADGRPALNENWIETVYAPVEQDGRDVLLHETIHPEPVTLPRTFPHARRIRCVGALHPLPLNGIAQGLAVAVRTGALSMETAVDFLWDMNMKKQKNHHNHNKHNSDDDNTAKPNGLVNGAAAPATKHTLEQQRPGLITQLYNGTATLNQLYAHATQTAGSLAPYRHALQGLLWQVRSGECSVAEIVRFLADSARGSPVADYRGGIMVRVVGTRDGGRPAVVLRRGNPGAHAHAGRHAGKQEGEEGDAPPPSPPQSMATDIGACAAAFVVMALKELEGELEAEGEGRREGQERQNPLGKKHARAGVFCPEDWTDLQAFQKCAALIC